mmetsp:Transcript_27783/g.72122  ORF Transcript_27783/g.72122 Transcript_27783/m.72122 type:complete len:205 (-) Transcript_27783:61-675(-)
MTTRPGSTRMRVSFVFCSASARVSSSRMSNAAELPLRIVAMLTSRSSASSIAFSPTMSRYAWPWPPDALSIFMIQRTVVGCVTMSSDSIPTNSCIMRSLGVRAPPLLVHATMAAFWNEVSTISSGNVGAAWSFVRCSLATSLCCCSIGAMFRPGGTFILASMKMLRAALLRDSATTMLGCGASSGSPSATARSFSSSPTWPGTM